MRTYDLRREKSTPLYEQLYDAIKKDILSGAIRGGEKLPSKRALSAHLNISKVTVETAYFQLLSEGYVTAREKVGYFAEEIAPISVPEQTTVAEEAVRPQLPPGGCRFPVSVWAKLTRRVLMEQGDALMTQAPGTGLSVLRSAIAQELLRSRGMSVSPSRIVIGAGAEYLYNLLIQLLGRDLTYGLEALSHQKIPRIYAANGVKTAAIAMDENGVIPESAAAAGVEVLHISPSHQFPTGVIMPVRRRQELLRFLSEGKLRYLIEDDYDAEFRFVGRPLPAMQSMDPTGRVIYLNTFSRTISPSLRISYLVLPPTLMERYEKTLSFYSCTVPTLDQLTLARFLSEGYFEKQIGRMRNFYQATRKKLLEALKIPGISVSDSGSGLHFTLRVEPPSRVPQLTEALQAAGLTLTPVSAFENGLPCSDPKEYVLGYAGLRPEALGELQQRLGEVRK